MHVLSQQRKPIPAQACSKESRHTLGANPCLLFSDNLNMSPVIITYGRRKNPGPTHCQTLYVLRQCGRPKCLFTISLHIWIVFSERFYRHAAPVSQAMHLYLCLESVQKAGHIRHTQSARHLRSNFHGFSALEQVYSLL